jgi:hypothetical protein
VRKSSGTLFNPCADVTPTPTTTTQYGANPAARFLYAGLTKRF